MYLRSVAFTISCRVSDVVSSVLSYVDAGGLLGAGRSCLRASFTPGCKIRYFSFRFGWCSSCCESLCFVDVFAFCGCFALLFYVIPIVNGSLFAIFVFYRVPAVLLTIFCFVRHYLDARRFLAVDLRSSCIRLLFCVYFISRFF